MTADSKIVRKIEFKDGRVASELFGPHNKHLDIISEKSGVGIESRGSTLLIEAETPEDADAVARLLAQLYEMVRKGRHLSYDDIDQGWRIIHADPGASLRAIFGDTSIEVSGKKKISPKSLRQREYLEAIRKTDMVFGIGPAGTGKTYLAVAMAVAALNAREVKRLILTRPAVEAGERLGFLPGDMVEKINPYLRPLYDALHDMLDFAKVQELIEAGRIEIAPLAFMRGRTLNDAFIILDEAQNTTPEQMKMFLTRLGFNSRAVITGDVTQVDLPGSTTSGLIEARNVLQGIKGITFVAFDEEDVVRHPLVGRIVHAYERHEKAAEKKQK